MDVREKLQTLYQRLSRNSGIVCPAERYAPCLDVVDDEDALAHFAACVAATRREFPSMSAKHATQVERIKFGYYAGFAPDAATRLRVERLYGCVHPFAGPATTPVAPGRCIQLSEEFDCLASAWNKQPPGSRAFGMYAQPRA
jgi:hypothetical protein